MKTLLSFLGAVICSLSVLAQDVPLIKVGEKELGVAKLEIDVAVVGNKMTTTYDMYFYNPDSDILEGELSFPLEENQQVSRFALDINGKLREAVAVEKEQGRVAFEAVVRRKVDPALLEKGTGNNYKARIYPIPAKGYKRVVLAYDEELTISDGKHLLKVPLELKKKLEEFRLTIQLSGAQSEPNIVDRGRIRSEFIKEGAGFVLNYSAQNFKPSAQFLAEVPLTESVTAAAYKDFAYAYRPIANPEIARKQPASVKLLWDVSYSMIERDLAKEFEFLDAYFSSNPNIEVQVVTFSDAVVTAKNFKITDGKWSGIKNLLSNCIYDGATSYNALFNNISSHDELLVFTDGMNTLSDFPASKTQPLFIVNSIKKANHAKNKAFGEGNQGGYINLSNLSVSDAITKIKFQPLQFLGIGTKNSNLEFYPREGDVVFNDFSFAAKGVQANQEIELLFGYGNVITLKESFRVPKQSNAKEVEIAWAQKKLKALQNEGESKKGETISLAKEYNLVSNYTSLIVLETLEDYQQFAIAPPKDLQDEEEVVETKISATEKKVNRDKKGKENTSFVKSSTMNNSNLKTGESALVTGKITDSNGLALPGVNVIIENTATGTQTDFEGNYSISVPVGGSLVYSYIGFDTLATTVRGSGAINIGMQDDAQTLATVMVTGYTGAAKKKAAFGGSVSTLKASDFNDKPESDAVRSMNGKIAGVQITGSSGATGSSTNFVIRSKSSISGNNQPLFIVDGIPFNSNTNTQGGLGAGGSVTSSRFLDLDPNMIQSVQVLKGLSAAVLYGQAGRNGVVIIQTKNDVNSNLLSSNYYVRTEAEREETANQRRELMREKTIRELGFSTPYLEELQAAVGVEDVYSLYLSQREQYKTQPSYFVDVFDFFKNVNAKYAERILSNLVEMDNDNYELLRVYGYKLEEKGDYETAAFIYRQVLELRSEDVQSYRDLALALAEIGEEEEALTLLNKIIAMDTGGSFRFRNAAEIKPIVEKEIANLLQNQKGKRNPHYIVSRDYVNLSMDLRVVIDWNHNDTDIDLYVVDPNLEECYYGNDTTKMGGMISEDMTEGFGPEEFTLIKATPGSYYVKIDYFGDNYQKVENPTFMKVSIYENYGTSQQKRRIKVMRLAEDGDEKLVDRIALL